MNGQIAQAPFGAPLGRATGGTGGGGAATLAALYALGTTPADSLLAIDAVQGGVVFDGTDENAIDPVTVINTKPSGGYVARPAGTAATGYVLQTSASVYQGAFGLAGATNAWTTGTVAGDVVLVSGTVAAGTKKIVVKALNASGGVYLLSPTSTGPGVAGWVVADDANYGTQVGYGGNSLTVNNLRSTFVGPAAFSASASVTAVALQVAGDPNTGIGQISGADTLSVVVGGVERAAVNANGIGLGAAAAANFQIDATAGFAGIACRSNTTGGYALIKVQNSGQTSVTSLMAWGSTSGATQFGLTNASSMLYCTAGVLAIGTTAATDMLFGTNNVERARILSAGDVNLSRGTMTDTSGTVRGLYQTANFAPPSGTANFRAHEIAYTINPTAAGGASGTEHGLLIAATITNTEAMTHRLLELRAGAAGTTSLFTIDELGYVSILTGGLVLSNGCNLDVGTSAGTTIGSGATRKLSLWGATPVVQPATTGTATGFVAGGGTTVTDASTFTAGVGTKAYRISDIVLALKQAGLMASS